jgi:hypothetical protein
MADILSTLSELIPVIAAVIGAAFVIAAISDLVQGLASKRWPSTSGKVSRARMNEHIDRDGNTYSPHIEYAYRVGTETYRGQRVFFGDRYSSGLRFMAQRVVNRYRPGSAVRVHYSPAQPDKSVLEAGPHWLSILASLVISALSALLAWTLWT